MPTPRTLRGIVADEHRFYGEALARALTGHAEFEATATSDYAALPTLIRTFRADVVLLAVNSGDPDAFAVADEVVRRRDPARFLLVDQQPSDIVLEQASRVGAVGFLLSSEPFETIVAALRDAAAGRVFVSESLRDRLRPEPGHGRLASAIHGRLSQLTGRQLEVLRLLAMGRSVKEVARHLNLSEKSVDSHKYRIMTKLDIHDRVELARFAIREGLVTP